MHHRREPRHRYSNSNDRPDIVTFDPDKGCNVELNIALAHPWSSNIFQGHLSQMGCCRNMRREEEGKYAKEIYQVDQQSVTFP